MPFSIFWRAVVIIFTDIWLLVILIILAITAFQISLYQWRQYALVRSHAKE